MGFHTNDLLLDFANHVLESGKTFNHPRDMMNDYLEAREIKTLKDLLTVPTHLLNDYIDMSEIPPYMREAIEKYMSNRRRGSIIKLADFMDICYGNYSYILEEKKDHSYYEKIEKLKEELVKLKFGSVVYDW